MSSNQSSRRIYTRQELLAAGVPAAAITAARRRGDLVSLQRGIYGRPGKVPPLDCARAALLAVWRRGGQRGQPPHRRPGPRARTT